MFRLEVHFLLKKKAANPISEAGKMLSKSSHFKAGSLACAAVSGAIWLIDGRDIKNRKVTTSISVVSGIAALAMYASALRFDWMAGKYFQMSASPGGLSASVTF